MTQLSSPFEWCPVRRSPAPHMLRSQAEKAPRWTTSFQACKDKKKTKLFTMNKRNWSTHHCLVSHVSWPWIAQMIRDSELQAVWERLAAQVDDVDNRFFVKLHLREALRHKSSCKSKTMHLVLTRPNKDAVKAEMYIKTILTCGNVFKVAIIRWTNNGKC